MTAADPKSPVLLWAVAFVVIGVLAVVVGVPESPPRPRLHSSPFSITESAGTPVTPERCLELPLRFGDFDLHCVVELPVDGELDLIFRKVEHWGPRDVELPLFHTRFSVLRMSSRAEGPGFLTREAALFGDPQGGVRISPGEPGASLRLECRGRTARANVNGIELEPFQTSDEFGNLALVVRGGAAVVKEFRVTPWPAAQAPWPTWLTALVVGLGFGLLGAIAGGLGWLGAAPWQVAAAGVLAVATSWTAAATVFDQLLPAARAEFASSLLTALSGLPLAFGIALRWPGSWSRIPLALVVGGGLAVWATDRAVGGEAGRLAPFEDDRFDLVFGPESGTAPFDAMTRMLRCEFVAHTLLPQRYDVLLLGGKLLFDFHEPGKVEKNVGARLPGLLKQRLRLSREQQVLVAATPTELAHVFQQYLLFTNYYHEYRPKVVVLGITGEEAEAMLHLPARQVIAAVETRQSARPGLPELWRRRARDKSVLQSPADLALTLSELQSACQGLDCRLVLALDVSTPEAYRTVATEFAKARKIPVVGGFDIYGGGYPVVELAEAVVGELIK